ncbi:MAG: hypothetical protein ACKER6_00465 [Candidatus Hodgkinia cicadicola]
MLTTFLLILIQLLMRDAKSAIGSIARMQTEMVTLNKLTCLA